MERCLRILKNSPSDPRTPEILLCLIEIHSALKNHEKARKLYLELKKRYPYSEATAHASLKWNDHK
jgi:TolA-binding protein